MIVIRLAVMIAMWVIAAAFAFSDLLCILALIHNWKDREFVLVIGVVTLIFALFAVGAGCVAMEVKGALP